MFFKTSPLFYFVVFCIFFHSLILNTYNIVVEIISDRQIFSYKETFIPK